MTLRRARSQRIRNQTPSGRVAGEENQIEKPRYDYFANVFAGCTLVNDCFCEQKINTKNQRASDVTHATYLMMKGQSLYIDASNCDASAACLCRPQATEFGVNSASNDRACLFPTQPTSVVNVSIFDRGTPRLKVAVY